ncbi:MAG: stage V sporulation protein AD [Oscillospiraceae bacterium]|jgi:stage V sporulation protein AD|nr:stage V sporulation protein AD [Oscillospiraceae bacterium]
MPAKKIGKRTVRFESPPSVISSACVGGKREREGPLSEIFDYLSDDAFFGEDSWEKAESKMQTAALEAALSKASLPPSALGCILAGDLLPQCTASSFGLRGFGAPYWGVYGACSTSAESLALAAMLLDGGFFDVAACVTGSHFCSAERQFRTPLEYGGQRTPTAQRTVTGCGAFILSSAASGKALPPLNPHAPAPPTARGGTSAASGKAGVYITHATTGVIIDAGISDPSNMGAAMAPAAYDTISAHLRDLGVPANHYDLIVTGDLGAHGADILTGLLLRDGFDISDRYNDCGLMIYNREEQDMHCGGSGCGCSASVLAGKLIPELRDGSLKRVLFCATGALLSATSALQGESIPGICYAVALER